MAAVGHALAETNTNQTTSTTLTWLALLTLSSASLVAGHTYAVLAGGQFTHSVNGGQIITQVNHNSVTLGEGSYMRFVTAGERFPAAFALTFTAVSGQDLVLQWFNQTTGTANGDFLYILVIDLNDLAASDWAFAEVTADSGLSTTPLNGASVTFTPGGASDWLVFSRAMIDQNSSTTSAISRLERSGEASSVLPEARIETDDVDIWESYLLHQVFSLTAASNTFTEQSFTSSGISHTRRHSEVFALRLDAFRNHAFAYTEADASLSSTNYATQLQTLSLTPDVTGDVALGAYWGFDRNNAGREAEFRVQVDGADQPSGQTTANYQFDAGGDASDESPHSLATLLSLSNAAHTVDLDASADSTAGTPAGQQRCLWAVTMELPAAGAADYPYKPVHTEFVSRGLRMMVKN